MAIQRKRIPSVTDPALRQKLDAARLALLGVHKALLDNERVTYERFRGRVASSGAFLQLVINDPEFAWLRPISELVVQIDELLVTDDPAGPADAQTLLTQARDLLRPNENGEPFRQRYHRAIQESPEVAVAHGEWKRAIGAK
jgi:hypothetical protein